MCSKPRQALVAVLGAMVFLACPAGSHRKQTSRDFGPYPLDLAREPLPEWDEPAKQVERARKANAAPRALLANVVAETQGDPVAVAETLARKAADPDAAQALLALMRDLAPRGSERQAREAASAAANATKPPAQPLGEPMIPLKQGEPGLVAVARANQVLKARMGTPTQGRFDDMLFQESTRLMGAYGPNPVDKGQKVPLIHPRDLSMEFANTSNNDLRLATYLDVLLRFPGTREGFKAVQALGNESGGVEDAYRDSKMYPLTLQKMLQVYDRDMAIVFGNKPWSKGDLLLHGISGPGGFIHLSQGSPYEYAQIKAVAEAGKAIFLNYYKKTINNCEDSETVHYMSSISSDARHLGLPSPKYKGLERRIKEYKENSYARKEWLESRCAKKCGLKPLWEE